MNTTSTTFVSSDGLHRLKCHPPYFQEVSDGNKTFEIRFNDRDYRVGDTLILEEFDPRTQSHTGRMLTAEVSYITDFAQHEGTVVMALRGVKRLRPAQGGTPES